ncbi:MAG: nitrogenase component 1 [Lachnospiraceae bacterium]|nr:nitrogenase component 1 [Lachnospiraceae bacterium]
MSIKDRYVLSREKRLTTISHYDGTLGGLWDELTGQEIRQRVRTFTQDSYSEIQYALHLLGSIRDTAIVVHGAIGCAASGIYYNVKDDGAYWYSTNLKERDTILGGDNQLREAVLRAQEETGAKAVFVVGTPVIAINNDDVSSILLELEDEIPVPCIFINVDGFKTKAGINGCDVVAHALAKYVVKKAPEKEDFVNLISMTEKKADVEAAKELLTTVGVRANVVGRFSGIADIQAAGAAKASVVLDSDEGGYFAELLEEGYGVEYIQTDAPIGIRGTRHFLEKLAGGLKDEALTERIGDYFDREQEKLKRYTGRKRLDGRRVFLHTTVSRAKVYARLIVELGGEVAGIAVPYIDPEIKEKLAALAKEQPELPIVVAGGQPYELANIVRRVEPYFYLSDRGEFAFLDGTDVIPLPLSGISTVGYDGVAALANRIEKLLKGLERAAGYGSEPTIYKETWLKRSSNWYVKQEVR